MSLVYLTNNLHASSWKYNASKLSEYNRHYPKGHVTFGKPTQWILNPSIKANNTWIGQRAYLLD
jgi:hypothetical protein